jgi:esterase/lipase
MEKEIKPVNYDELTKEELVQIIKSKDTAYDNLKVILDKTKEDSDNMIKEITDTYKKKIEGIGKVIKYYQNKLAVIKSLVDLEGGEK